MIETNQTEPQHPAAFPMEMVIKEPVSLQTYVNYLGGWYQRVFSDMNPIVLMSICQAMGAGALTEEDVHHLAMCKKALAEKKKLTALQLDQWQRVWGDLMAFLRGRGLKRIAIMPWGMIISTDTVPYPWMTH